MSSTIRTIVKKNENIRNATREVWEPFQLYQSYHNWVECHRWPRRAPVCVCRSLARIDTCGEFGLYTQSSGSHPSDAHRSRAVGESHMGPEDTSNRKKITIIFLKPNFRKLQNNFKNVSLRIGSSVPQKLGPFFSLFLMRKTLSSGLFLTLGSGTSTAGNENLRPLLNRNVPLISGKYGLRNLRNFDHWKVFFSWGKVRKRALTFEVPCSRF